MAIKAAFLTGFLFILVSDPVYGKVVNLESKNDVSATQNETVSVVNIEDLNKTQYHNQNFRSGNYNYGYDVKPEGPNGQFHHENKAQDGIVYGCYGYVDPNDKPQVTYYVSDSWGYRPVPVRHSMKLFYPSEHPEGATEMKGHQKEWSQLEFPNQCLNLGQEAAAVLSNAGSRVSTEFLPPPGLIKAPSGIPISLANSYSPVASQPINREIGYPGALGRPGGPGTLTNGGYGGEGGTGGLVSGSAAANGGPGGSGGDGGTSSGSSKASGGNGGSGGNAGGAIGNSVADGGNGGHGGDGGEASGSSDASGGHGGIGGRGGSASGNSKAVGGDAGSGGKGGIASGSSTALGGGGGNGGEGGNASGSSKSGGGAGGSGGRGGTASGSSSANGGTAGSGGKGGATSGSSSASAGDGGSAGNGGVAAGNSAANGGSGGSGGSGAGVVSWSSDKIGYSYTPPKEFGATRTKIERVTSSISSPSPSSLPLPASGGLLSEEQYTHELANQHNKRIIAPTIASLQVQTETGYTYPRPSLALQQFSEGVQNKLQFGNMQQESNQQLNKGPRPTNQLGNSRTPQSQPQPQSSRPNLAQPPIQHPPIPQQVNLSGQRHPGSGEYFPGSTSQPLGLNPPAYQQHNFGDRFQTSNTYPPTQPSYPPRPNHIQAPAGGYVPPVESSESGERDQNTLGYDSGEQQPPLGNPGCGQGFSSCNNQQPPQEIDYASIPGAITSNIPVIFYPDCRSNAYTRPAIVPFCPSLQQAPPSSSCSHQSPLTMKFPTGGNPYNNVPSSRGAYPSNFGNAQPRPNKRVVRRSRHH